MFIKFLLPCLLLVASLCMQSCQKCKETPSNHPEKTVILVSIAPYQTMVEKIAGKSFVVQTVVPPGSNPHEFEPTTKQVSKIRDGIVWFRIGEPFESKLLSVLEEKNPDLIAIDLRDKIDLIHEAEHQKCHCSTDLGDRHIWLSPKLAMVQAQTIASVLSERFPEYKNVFLQNSQDLMGELKRLDEEIETILSRAEIKTFAVSHSAFAYFCKDYHLTQISIELGGKDPTLKYLAKITDDIQTLGTKLGIAMPQHSNKGLEVVAGKLGLEIHTIDPYSPDFFHTLRSIAHWIAETK